MFRGDEIQEFRNMDDLIEMSLIAISIFLMLVLGALGIGLGHIIFVWCGVL